MKAEVKTQSRRHAGGRPAKFNEPSRPVTVTLPESVLRLLATLDADRAKAIVKLTNRALGPAPASAQLVEMAPVSPTQSVILVANSRSLRSIPWLNLVEVSPAKNLLSVQPGTPVEKLEVTIDDLLEDLADGDPVERELIGQLRHCLRGTRRSQLVTRGEILLVERPPVRRR